MKSRDPIHKTPIPGNSKAVIRDLKLEILIPGNSEAVIRDLKLEILIPGNSEAVIRDPPYTQNTKFLKIMPAQLLNPQMGI